MKNETNWKSLKLTKRYFKHAKGPYYRNWDENLMSAMLGHLPTRDNGIISFFFCEYRCHYSILFSEKTGECLGITQYFNSTKIVMGEYVFPLIELIASMTSNGYLEFANTERSE